MIRRWDRNGKDWIKGGEGGRTRSGNDEEIF